jgi:hypothetical protein
VIACSKHDQQKKTRAKPGIAKGVVAKQSIKPVAFAAKPSILFVEKVDQDEK